MPALLVVYYGELSACFCPLSTEASEQLGLPEASPWLVIIFVALLGAVLMTIHLTTTLPRQCFEKVVTLCEGTSMFVNYRQPPGASVKVLRRSALSVCPRILNILALDVV